MALRPGILSLLVIASTPALGSASLQYLYDTSDQQAPTNGTWYAQQSQANETGLYAWNTSYAMMSYIAMYRATSEERYLDRLTYIADIVLSMTDEARGVTDYNGRSRLCWRSSAYSSKPVCWAAHTGMIAYPMVDLAVLTQMNPGLAAHVTYDGTMLGQKASIYLSAGEAAAALYDNDWRDSGTNQGYYIYPIDATFYPYAGEAMPLNQMNAMGRLLTALYNATGSATYLDKVTRLANYMLTQFQNTATGYTWDYWMVNNCAGSYCAGDASDISHGGIDVEFVVRAAESGIVFNSAHLSRLATTFTNQVYQDSATTFDQVNGAGSTNSDRAEIGRWAQLASFDPAIHAIVRSTSYFNQAAGASVMLGLAYLMGTDAFVRPFSFGIGFTDQSDREQASNASAFLSSDLASASTSQLLQLSYSATRPVDVAQWNGSQYIKVARLAATGGSFVTAYVMARADWVTSGNTAQFELTDSGFTSGTGITLLKPGTMDPPVLSSAAPGSTLVSSVFSYQATATGPGPMHWWIVAGPSGLTVDPWSGAVSWTPTSTGQFSFTLAAENDHGQTQGTYTVNVVSSLSPNPPPSGGGGSPPSGSGSSKGGGVSRASFINGTSGCSAGGGGPGGLIAFVSLWAPLLLKRRMSGAW